MKNLYMVQPNSQYGNSVYFPYAAGSLVAYAFEDADIKNEYCFKSFVYKKDDIDSVIDSFDNPYLTGFSCYVWNYEYNKEFAKKLKAKYPDCIIVFGGHQINENSDVIDSDYVDYVILGEGEEAFKQLLLSLAINKTVSGIPGILYKENEKNVFNKTEVTCIPERVSAYLGGWFDPLLEDKDICFSAILETNRGCPNKCAFCDWGNIKSRVHHYDLQTVKAEIDWMADNKIEYCYCADANFGLFERDCEIVDYLIKKHNETGYPEKFQATYSKNNAQTVFEINKRLNEAGMCKGATLSFQSMDSGVLDNIYRKNMPLESFLNLMTLYTTNSIPTYSELILGLPGETYESFKNGIEKLLECGQHMNINIFNCEMLANSIMNKADYIEKYKIKYAKTQQHQYHVVPDKDDIREYSNIVVSTSSMPTDKWIESNIFGCFVRAFHNLGLLQCVAIYLYYEKGIKYKDFYCDLIDFAKENENTFCSYAYNFLMRKYGEVSDSKGSLTSFDEVFGELTWPLDEFVFLKAVENYDKFYSEITPVIKKYFDDELLFDELIKYQQGVVKTPFTTYKELDLSYDFYSYFSNIYGNNYSQLIKKNNTILINISKTPKTFPQYAKETIWYGRKGGQNIASDITYKSDNSI